MNQDSNWILSENDEFQRELRLARFKLEEERALNARLEEKIRLHNTKVGMNHFLIKNRAEKILNRSSGNNMKPFRPEGGPQEVTSKLLVWKMKNSMYN